MKIVRALFFVVAVIFSGCSGQVASPQLSQSHPAEASTIAFNDSGLDATGQLRIGVNLEANPIRDPRYRYVIGYFKGTTSQTSQIISVGMGRSVKFVNVDDNDAHTASFLGDATAHMAPSPAHFNGSSTASPAGTAIGTHGFSTGPLNPHQASALYSTGLPGFYMIGCFFHYDSNRMRTVIIVR